MKYIIPALFFSVLSWNSCQGLTISGASLDDELAATSERPKLLLNGAALREMYFLVETFVGGLYLEERSRDAQAIIKSKTHKRMVFVVMLNKVGARRIGNEMQAALVGSISHEEHLALGGDIDQMLSYFDGKLFKGESVEFDYIPGTGTLVTIKGLKKGIIKGDDYFNALLATWIGEKPVDRSFKKEVLGLNMPSHLVDATNN
ncbi:MAG: chalcone isomerase family protein [Bermanella sp.]